MNEQGHARRLFVHGALLEHPVIARHFAVLAREDDDGVVSLSGLFERAQYLPDIAVDEGHVGEVLGAELSPSHFGRGVVDVAALYGEGIESA